MRTALLFLVLVVSGCNNQIPPFGGSQNTTTGGTAAASGNVGTPPLPERWEATTLAIDDVQVSITQVGEETTRVENASVFAIRLSILNTSFSKRLNYLTWAHNGTLRDNFGNTYNRIPRPKGVGVQELPLDPTVPVIDTLLFELPIATAGSVVLHLPGSNVRQQEAFNLRMILHTSGARLEAVTTAAAAAEAQAKAKTAAIAAKEAEAKRAVREAAERKRILELEAEQERRAAEAKAEQERRAAEAKADLKRQTDEARKKVEDEKMAEQKRIAQREAAIADLEKKLATAQANKKSTEIKLRELKETQFASLTKKAQQDLERLIVEIADLEVKLASLKKAK